MQTLATDSTRTLNNVVDAIKIYVDLKHSQTTNVVFQLTGNIPNLTIGEIRPFVPNPDEKEKSSRDKSEVTPIDILN